MPFFHEAFAAIARDLGTPEAARVARRVYRREFALSALALAGALLALGYVLAGCGERHVGNLPVAEDDGVRRLGAVGDGWGCEVRVLRDPDTGAHVYVLVGTAGRSAISVLPADAARPKPAIKEGGR